MTVLAAESISLGDLAWNPHPEVWLLISSLVAIAWYMRRVLEPKAVAAGYPPLTGNQKFWFLAAGLSLWASSDWPVHDVAENYLYFVHMIQHLFISMLIPAMFLLALPPWLFRLLVPAGSAGYRFLSKASRPIVAGVIFNAITAFLHWSAVVDLSARSAPAHFSFHLLIFASGLLMWMPVLSPVAEWRIRPVPQCIFLFLMSIMPTVPSGWLIFAEDVVYRHYDTSQRLWGVDVLSDQQAAGVIMKLVGGFFLWGVIVVIYTRWATEEMRRNAEDRRARQAAQRAARQAARTTGQSAVPGSDVGAPATATSTVTATIADTGDLPLTFEQVASEFARNPAPPDERPA